MTLHLNAISTASCYLCHGTKVVRYLKLGGTSPGGVLACPECSDEAKQRRAEYDNTTMPLPEPPK